MTGDLGSYSVTLPATKIKLTTLVTMKTYNHLMDASYTVYLMSHNLIILSSPEQKAVTCETDGQQADK